MAVRGCLLSLLWLLLLTSCVTHAATIASSPSRGPWLVDLIDYDYQGDSPKEEDSSSSSRESCPSVPKSYPRAACHRPLCNTDHDCRGKKHSHCCFNGCIYTCTPAIDQPALIDWRVAPRRIAKSAPYWLIKDPETPDEYQSCSTTTEMSDDADPLLCPDGYVCHIVTPGDPEHNIPNRGWCVKERDDKSRVKDYERHHRRKKKHRDPTSCYEDSIVFLNGASVHYKGKWCNCVEGRLTCKRKQRS